jgi:predicted lipid-binding transport protein (Tim44 family)
LQQLWAQLPSPSRRCTTSCTRRSATRAGNTARGTCRMNAIRRHSKAARSSIAAGIAFLVWVGIPTLAAARGGGGNHSSGGSSGGGVSGIGGGGYYGGGSSGLASSGGGGGGTGLGLVAFLLFGGGFIVVLFVLWVLIRMFSSRKTVTAMAASGAYAQQYNPNLGLSGGGVNNTPVSGGPAAPVALSPGPAMPAMPGLTQGNGLDEIKAADPGFNEEQFLDRCQIAFSQVQQAWMDRNVEEGRAYMSTGLHTTWSMQIQQMIAAYKHDVMEDLFVQHMSIVSATHDANFDTITVRVDASCKDYEIDDNSGKVVFGDNKHDKPFTEMWTFQRSAGAKTLVSGGVTDKKCPNCGAPLSINQNGSCTYCNAPVTSGKFDWVLSHIEQNN